LTDLDVLTLGPFSIPNIKSL